MKRRANLSFLPFEALGFIEKWGLIYPLGSHKPKKFSIFQTIFISICPYLAALHLL